MAASPRMRELAVANSEKELSTETRLMRYTVKSGAALALRLSLAALLLVLGAGGLSRAQAAEEPLSPEFIEYLGDVESSGIKGIETLSLEDLYLLLKNILPDTDALKKKDDHPKGKEKEHGDVPNQ